MIDVSSGIPPFKVSSQWLDTIQEPISPAEVEVFALSQGFQRLYITLSLVWLSWSGTFTGSVAWEDSSRILKKQASIAELPTHTKRLWHKKDGVGLPDPVQQKLPI